MPAAPTSEMASPTRPTVSEGPTVESVTSWGRGRWTLRSPFTPWRAGSSRSALLLSARSRLLLHRGMGNGDVQRGRPIGLVCLGDAGGWFAGVAWNLELAESRMLTFMSEYNGFDWNVGTQVDLTGVRLGAHVLGVNHSSNTTVYRSSKFGLIASVAICGRGLCRASLRDRPDPDVVVLPAAPPDTVVITRVESAPRRPEQRWRSVLRQGTGLRCLSPPPETRWSDRRELP